MAAARHTATQEGHLISFRFLNKNLKQKKPSKQNCSIERNRSQTLGKHHTSSFLAVTPRLVSEKDHSLGETCLSVRKSKDSFLPVSHGKGDRGSRWRVVREASLTVLVQDPGSAAGMDSGGLRGRCDVGQNVSPPGLPGPTGLGTQGHFQVRAGVQRALRGTPPPTKGPTLFILILVLISFVSSSRHYVPMK